MRFLRHPVPSSLAHYAVSAGILAAIGLRGRTLAIAALWAVVPDLDILTAVPWSLVGPELGLGADGLVTGQYLFGHRGLSHTFLMAGLVAVGVAAWTRRAKPALVAGLAWGSHVLLDALSPWPTTPYWPFSSAKVHVPIVTGLDPILTLVSAAAIVALLGPLARARWSSIPGALDRWREARSRWGHRLAAASVAAVLVNVAWLGAVAATHEADLSETYSANVPRTVTVVPTVDGWVRETHWFPGTSSGSEVIPEVDNRSAYPDVQPALASARCTIEELGPYNPVDDPIWVVRPGEEGLTIEALDLVRNATGSGSPRLIFTFDNGTVDQVTLTGEQGEDSWLRLPVPGPVVEAARCR